MLASVAMNNSQALLQKQVLVCMPELRKRVPANFVDKCQAAFSFRAD